MSGTNSVVAIFESHERAEDAIRELPHSGFDMKKLSIIGKDYHSEENVVGYSFIVNISRCGDTRDTRRSQLAR